MFEETAISKTDTQRSPEPKGRRLWSGQGILRLTLAALLVISALAFGEGNRKIKTSVPPEYPELARKLNIRGTARVQATIAPDGSVKEVRELGGNPVLVDALSRAVKKWRYEPASTTSTVEVQFVFGTE